MRNARKLQGSASRSRQPHECTARPGNWPEKRYHGVTLSRRVTRSYAGSPAAACSGPRALTVLPLSHQTKPHVPSMRGHVKQIARRPAEAISKLSPLVEEPAGIVDGLTPSLFRHAVRALALKLSPCGKVALRGCFE